MAAEHDTVHPPLSTGRRHAAGQVSICFDPRDDVAVTRAVHARCAGGGQVAVSPGPDAAAAETLALSVATVLGVLWRVPRRLRSGRAVFSGEDRAQLEWEISWALHRDGIGVLWVLDAGRVGLLGWRWLYRLAVRERLHVVLLVVGDPPDRWQAAALQGVTGPRLLPPERLHAGSGSSPWWHRPAHRRTAHGPGPLSHKRPSTTDPADPADADDVSAGRALSQSPLENSLAQHGPVSGFR